MKDRKYKFTDETKEVYGTTLHRIVALKDFAGVENGDKGGWIENENNLSQYGNAWVYGDAMVYGNAQVYDNAQVYGNARVYGNAWVYSDARVYGNARVFGNAWVYSDARVYGNAQVYDNARVFGRAEVFGIAMVYDNAGYIVFKNFWSSGRYFTWTRSNNMWRVGCFYGSGEELIAKAYKDSEKSGREYERVVRYVESILADEQKENK